MDEPTGPTPPAHPAATSEPSTSVPAVEEVLGWLEHLPNLPVEEHLPIFEQAHEQLRRALDSAPAD